MPRTTLSLNSFVSGEFSPRMDGRVDFDKYFSATKTLQNFLVSPQGSASRRVGTKFIAEVKDSTKAVRLLSFTFSTVQTMVIEMGDQYFRFHTQGQTLIYNNGTAWNSGTSYVVGDIA